MERAAVRFAVRVRPGASRTRVGGSYGEGELIVAVTDRAVDGRATQACLRAVAEALGARRSAVHLVSGATRRTKILEVDAGDGGEATRLRERLDALRAG